MQLKLEGIDIEPGSALTFLFLFFVLALSVCIFRGQLHRKASVNAKCVAVTNFCALPCHGRFLSDF